MTDAPHCSVVVAIATAGRRNQLPKTFEQISRQTRLPDRVVICPASPVDIDEDFPVYGSLPAVEIVYGGRGLTVQRNRILSECTVNDIVIFFDDDYYPAPDYISKVCQVFMTYSDIVVLTGHPVLDGAVGPGICHEDAVTALDRMTSTAESPVPLVETYGGYGCNMSIRLAPVIKYQLRFDEQLPLYGWLEDIDFSRTIAKFGRIVASSALQGVHLGTKQGRGSGLRLGYSQIANTIYMMRKGTMSWRFGLRLMSRNIVSNLARSLRPEAWVDRRGRLRGNLVAIGDLCRGKVHPRKVMSL